MMLALFVFTPMYKYIFVLEVLGLVQALLFFSFTEDVGHCQRLFASECMCVHERRVCLSRHSMFLCAICACLCSWRQFPMCCCLCLLITLPCINASIWVLQNYVLFPFRGSSLLHCCKSSMRNLYKKHNRPHIDTDTQHAERLVSILQIIIIIIIFLCIF